eukprot:gene4319-7675_t
MEEQDEEEYKIFEDLNCSQARYLSKEEILLRMEMHILNTIQLGIEHSFDLIIRNSSNEEKFTKSFRLGQKIKKRRLNQQNTVRSYSQTWKTLQVMYKIVQLDQKITQRDLYYNLVSEFKSQNELNSTVLDICSIFECSRESLGIFATSKGFIAGNILWNEGKGWINGKEIGIPGIPIPGILPKELEIKTDARFIIVIEKDGVFKRLLEDEIFNTIPCIIITGCGFPDLATRMIVKRLNDQYNHIPIIGIFDYNPFGVSILYSYMYGSFNHGLESYKYTIPSMHWIGLFSQDIEELQLITSSLTTKDHDLLDKLIKDEKRNERFLKELKLMKQKNYKAEIQSLNNISFSFITNIYLRKKLLKRLYL